MNFTQIKYFITLAKCMNFTKAASQLYVTQPALSRQIQAMEQELNLILFMRNNRTVKLTPAAQILLKEFEKIYDEYNIAIAKAQNSFAGLLGELNIGILDGEKVGDLFPEVLQYFEKYYTNVKINLRNYSFNSLIEGLYNNTLDIIFTLKFDVKDRERIGYRIIEKTKDHVAVHKSHRLAEAKFVKLSDFRDDIIMMVDPNDSEESPKLIMDACKREDFVPKVKFAPSIQAEMLWVEAGVGVCILDSRNILRDSPAVKFLEVDAISDPSLSIAWNIDNYNPMKQIFIDAFLADIDIE
jgi:DNA-binding transcriptional LysR family regulator